MIEQFNLLEYKRQRSRNHLFLQLRKVLAIPARFLIGWQLRRQCLRLMGVKIGKSYIGRDCLFDEEAPELIIIEDGVTISSRVCVVTHDSWRCLAASVHICNGAFVGLGSILLPGVVIGEYSVVAAGAVVTKSVEPRTIVGGSPARLIRRIE